MQRTRPILAALALLFSLLSCSIGGGDGEGAQQIEAQVSGTLTAIAVEAEAAQQSTATASESEEITPTPTSPPPPATSLRVAFVSSGNVWLWEEATGATQLSSSGNAEDVRISDDGLLIVYLRRPASSQSSEIIAIDADGTDEKVLLNSAEVNGLHPSEGFLYNDVSSLEFLPGTHKLLLTSRAVAEGPGLIKYNDLIMLDADLDSSTVVRTAGNGGDFAISPDGSRVALVRPDTIGLIDPDGGNALPDLINYEQVITYSEFQYYAQPVWSTDSRAVMVTIPSPDPLADITSGTTYRIDAASGAVSELGVVVGDVYFSQTFTSPIPSPTHDHLGFLRIPSDTEARLILVNPDGSDETTYTTGDLEWRGWSPSGRYFLFTQGELSNVYVGRRGEEPMALVHGVDLQWIDDSRFIFLQGSPDSWTLRMGQVAGPTVDIASPGGDLVRYDLAPAD